MEQLTVKQVAAILGVTRGAVHYWIKNGLLPNQRIETPKGPYYLIPASALKSFQRPKRGQPRLSKAEKLARYARKLEAEAA